MRKNDYLPIMYDFYNENVLKGQNDDIDYYIKQIKKYKAKKVLIVGAGTGRVAIPLAEYANVTALDFDKRRLERLKKKTNKHIDILNYNFLKYDKTLNYDLVIFPYSTLQYNSSKKKIDKYLYKLYSLSMPHTISLLDISESFNYKPSAKNRVLFKKYCEEVKDYVIVNYSSIRKKDYMKFIVIYNIVNKNIRVIEKEKYCYYDKKAIENCIQKNNLKVLKTDSGYGKPGFEHKHIYHLQRKNY